MEKRAALAFALSILVLFAYLWVMESFFTPPPPPAPQAEAPSPGRAAAPPPPSRPAPATPAVEREPAPREPDGPRPPQKTATVATPLARGVVSSEGGKLQEWTLMYRGDKPMVTVGELGPRGLLAGADAASVEPLPMTLTPNALGLGPQRPRGEFVLAGETRGLRIRETLRFRADDYAFEVLIRAENPSATARTVTVALPWAFRRDGKEAAEKFPGQYPTEVVWATKDGVARIDDLAAVGRHEVEGAWVAMGSTWYLAALVPKTPGFTLVATNDAPDTGATEGEVRVAIAARATATIGPGQAWEGRVEVYVGPKEYDRLQAHGLEAAVNFGGFPLPQSYGGLPMEWIGVPILKLMNWLYRYLGNYGFVIIVLTIISKVLFFPLTLKSLRSMKAMQALAPQVNSLRSRYKNDPRKLQEETLGLYRKHKVNPMGGCLPMVAQIPVFYALYLALSVSVELQNAPFLCFGRAFGVDLWICDLASHDPTYVLPILMGASMFVQQKMTPTMGDPRQARMMLIMPFVFTFMFLNLPSGLVLYWFVSNVLQILQQWWMDRSGGARLAKQPARA